MKSKLFFILFLLTLQITYSQNGSLAEFKLYSTKGMTGSMKASFSDHGSLMEFNMTVPQIPGGIKTKTLMLKDKPGIIYSINDQNKSYSETTISESSKQDTKTYTVKKIGEETLNGYKCIHAIVTEGAETHEVWNTKDIPDYAKYAEAMKSNKQVSSQSREDALRAAGCDGVPVKTIHKGNARQGDITIELVKLEKKTFQQSDFEIPAGYTKGASGAGISGVKTQQEIMAMTPEERAKYLEELKKQYGK